MRTRFLSIVLLCALPAAAVDPAAAPAPKDRKSKEPAKPAAAASPASEKSAAKGSRLVVVRDQETGALRPPTAEEHERLTRELRQTLAPKSYRVVVNPDGSKKVLLDGYLSFSVVRRTENGGTEQRCFSDPDKAATFMTGPGALPVAEK